MWRVPFPIYPLAKEYPDTYNQNVNTFHYICGITLHASFIPKL